jgi:hypothetical protein
MRTRIPLLASIVVVVPMVMSGCSSSDPTASDEYAALNQELTQTNQELAQTKDQLADITVERDALAAEADSEVVDLPAGAAEALDSYTNTLLAADGEAMLAFVTEDFAFLSYGTDVQEREYRAGYVTSYYANFDVKTIGDPMVLGSSDTYIVAIPESATASSGVAEGFSTIRIIQDDGAWLVDVHRFTGE